MYPPGYSAASAVNEEVSVCLGLGSSVSQEPPMRFLSGMQQIVAIVFVLLKV